MNHDDPSEASPDDERTPTGSSDLLPSSLYPAEFVMLPLFWIPPLNLVVFGSALSLDGRRLERYGVETGVARWVLVAAATLGAHLVTLSYRYLRRKAFVERIDLTMSEFDRHLRAADPPSDLLRALFVGQLALAAVLALDGPGTAVGVGLAANLVAAPVLVFRDLREVRRVDGVEWGWPRYLHLAVAAVPPLVFVYRLQRKEHLTYALVVRLWDADPGSIDAGDVGPTPAERLGEWLGDRL